MKLVYEGPNESIKLNIGDPVVYIKGVPFEARGGYVQHLLDRLHPHRFTVVEADPEPAVVATPRKRVGRKPKEI